VSKYVGFMIGKIFLNFDQMFLEKELKGFFTLISYLSDIWGNFND